MMKLLILALSITVTFCCSWDYLIWIPRDKNADPLYRFVKNDKAGYIDGNGKIVIEPRFTAHGNYGGEFVDGRLEIAMSDGRYVDKEGRLVIDKGLHRGWDFSEGLAVAMKKGEDLWGYIDTSGKFAISPRFGRSSDNGVSSFSNGLAMITVKGKTGYIDHSGKFVIPPIFLDGSKFNDEFARVVTEGPCVYYPDGGCGGMINPVKVGRWDRAVSQQCKFTYIDKTGRQITSARFDFARNFSEGLAPVRIGKFWGFINKAGSLVVPLQFEDASEFSSGLSRILEKGLYGYVDKSGSVKIKPKYKYAENFSEGFAVVQIDSKYYAYIDMKGNDMGFGKFTAASPFFKGLAHVRFSSKENGAYLDTKGRRVFSY